MWHDLTHLGISVPDKIVRTLAVYLALIVLLRLAGKRDLAQLNTFDLIVVLLLSNVVQNAVIGPDNSLLGGLIGAAVLVGANSFFVHVIRPWRGETALLEGTTTVLARAGEWLPGAMRREGVRRQDLEGALRKQNAYKIEDVAELKLEPGGTIVVDLKPELENATKADVARLEAKLDRLLGA
ncbi:MAG TPA: YetF domain-containing protein [Nocardioides sp.]|jgi:uncharacterized membrane protein YcaP (DUF421 family)|nr:YetF domain-containing protein [Nocardioides sp.]